MAASVFISYARKDADLGAAPLDAALRPLYDVWRDLRGIDPAQDFTAEIEKAIQAASHVIVCVTPDTLREDSFVRREIAYANALKKPILVARFADVLPPIHIFTNTWIDFFKGWDAALETLRHWLGGEKVASTQTSSAPVQQTDPYKPYVEALYTDLVDSIRASVFSDETITLRAVETVGYVQRKTRQLNPKYIPYALRETPAPDPTPQAFDSLRDAYDHAHCAGRVLLLGEPGAGKTTTLLAFARDAAAARLSDPSQPLPIFARISGWDAHAQTPLHKWLSAIHSLDAAALRELIDSNGTLLLLDGLDELGSRRPVDPKKPDGEQYDPRERFLQMLPTTAKVILSSRVEDYRQIGAQAGLNCAVRLERLDDAQMQAYLADVAGLWEVINAGDDLKDALRTPLLLALVRVAYEDAPEDVRSLGGLNAGDLNDRIWDAFIDKRWQHEQARTPDDPLPYTAAELKRRLGLALIRVMCDRSRDDHIAARDAGMGDGKQVIALGLRLDLLRAARDKLVLRPSWEYTASWRFLHLRLRDAIAYPTAIAALRNPDESVRSSAATVLGRLSDTRAVEPLIARLRDKDDDVRIRAADALGRMGDTRAVKPLITKLRDRNRFVRRGAAIALGELGDARAVEPLIAKLSDPKVTVRSSAADALGRLGDIRAIEPLIEALRDPKASVRDQATNALGMLGELAVKPLISALSDSDLNICTRAARALVQQGEIAVEPLIAALQDQDWILRKRAAYTLGKLGDVCAVPPLISTLRDSNPVVRRKVARALGRLGDERAVDPLIATLNDSELAVRCIAIDALIEVGNARAVEPLILALGATESVIRNNAAYALGWLGDARVIEPLIATLRDPNERVRYIAFLALRRFADHPAARIALADYEAGKIKPRDE